jgi:hypothetical protein
MRNSEVSRSISTADDAIFVDAQGPAIKAEVMEHTAPIPTA